MFVLFMLNICIYLLCDSFQKLNPVLIKAYVFWTRLAGRRNVVSIINYKCYLTRKLSLRRAKSKYTIILSWVNGIPSVWPFSQKHGRELNLNNFSLIITYLTSCFYLFSPTFCSYLHRCTTKFTISIKQVPKCRTIKINNFIGWHCV